MEQTVKKKGGWRRVGRIVLKTLMWIFFLIIGLFLLILTPPVQNFITKKATNYLEKKLDTKVSIKRLFITLSGKIAIDGVYVEDRQKDTLLSVGELRVNMSFYKIIFKNELDIKSVLLNDGTARITRTLPDTTFNFQFIADAFGSGSTDSVKVADTSAAMAINIDKVELNHLRLVYKDVVTGNDIETGIGHFDTKVEKFDLDKMHFIVPQINLSEFTAHVIQVKPLVIIPKEKIDEAKAKQPTSASPVLQLELGKLSLKKIGIDFRDSVGLMYTNANIGNLDIRPRKIDLANQVFDLGDLLLENTSATVLMDKSDQPVVAKTAAADTAQKAGGIKLAFASLGLNNVNVRFDNNNSPKQPQGMDYAHINAGIQTLQAKDFLFSSDTIRASITKGNLKEQSGFELQQLQTDFVYASSGAYLKNLYLKTPGTEIKRSLAVSYPSIEALKTDIGSLQMDIDLADSKILVRDVLTFVPALRSQPAFADPNATWYLTGDIKGSVADMRINTLQIRGLNDTRINVDGRIVGLPDMKKASADLNIKEMSSSRRDIAMFVPAKSLPQNITLPGKMNITGAIKGNTGDLLFTDFAIRTDLGYVTIKGRLRDIMDPKKAQYDASVRTRSLDLGTIMQNKETLGPVTATFTAKGKGMDPKTANAIVKGDIQSAVFKKYIYKDLILNGSIANQLAKFDAAISDPNIDLDIQATANLSQPYPAVQLTAMIDSIKTKQLNLTPNSIIYHGKIDADFADTNPDDLDGRLFVTESNLVQDGRRIKLDTLQLLAGRNDSGHFARLQTDIVNARLQGEYKLTQLGTIFQDAINPYFTMGSDSTAKAKDPYDFTFGAEVINGPILQNLVPTLKRMDSVRMNGRFSDSAGWFVDARAPGIEIGTNIINGLEIKAGTDAQKDSINLLATVKQIRSGKTIQVDNTRVTAGLADNKIAFGLNINDGTRDKYNVGGVFQQPVTNEYEFSLNPTGLTLNYDPWTVSQGNMIRVAGEDINAKNFTLSQGTQQLSINSNNAEKNSPLTVGFNSFKIATLTGFVQSDSTLIDGMLNGKAEVRDVMKDPVFTSDITINNLSVKNDTVGDVKVLVNNETANTFVADVAITGRGNDVKLDGKYFTDNSSFDMDLDIRKLPLTTAQAFSAGAMTQATGSIDGKFDITGNTTKPSVRGALNFNKAGFNLAMLNNYLTIDQEKIQVDEQGIRFNKFELKDSANNALTIDGTAATTNFSNYNFDLDIKSANFRALNSTKKDNKLFYGQLYFNSNIKVTGTEAAPSIDGRLKVNDKTKMTVVLPQKDPGVVDREGVVEFVDFDAPPSDSLFMAAYDSLNTASASLAGMDVSLNVEIDKAADLTLVVDEGNGDFLNVKGEALLNVTIDPAGDIVMAGTYELEEGAYALSFNGIKRRFDIVKGSKITWGGEPTKADVNLTAKYIANTAPLDLVKGQLGEDVAAAQRNTYLQKLPFEVMLKMQGQLLQPAISFDIILPDNKSYIVSNDIVTTVRTKLDQLRQEEGEMNKQVFALLLLNRFVAENPFSSSTSVSAGTLARQSVSKLMTEQLNKLAADLVQGVELNFDVQSSDDYTSGSRADRTDLNVGLSKSLLNDRLTVTVGSNFELEAPANSSQQASNIAGNIGVNYRLSKDGRYQLRAYRKNEYQGVIDGYIIETGVGFIITIDYNRFREIFQKKKIERERLKRQAERQKNAPANNNETQKVAEPNN